MAANRTGPQEQVVPIGPARTSLAGDRASSAGYVVLSRSDELLEQVALALDGAAEIRHAEDEEDARQCIDSVHATVVLLDIREQVDPGLVVERLHASDGSTVIVVFAPADAMPDVARAIKGSAAFAVLPIPIEMDKTRAVLLGAGEEALARHALIAPPATSVVLDMPPRSRDPLPGSPVVDRKPTALRTSVHAHAGPVPPPAAGGSTPGASRKSRAALLVAACLLVAAAGTWFKLRGDDAAGKPVPVDAGPAQPVAAAEPMQPSPGAAADRSDSRLATVPREELLDRARVAFHERRYTEPVRDSALQYYRGVLAQDPLDAEALEGVERIDRVLQARLESALAERRTEDAARTLEQMRSIHPGDAALAAAAARLAEQRIGAALARGNADEASELLRAAAETGVSPDKLAPFRDQLARLDATQQAAQLTRLARARIRDGKLLSPPGDSAKHYLGQLLKLSNGVAAGADVQVELARALAERAQRASAQGTSDEAARWLAEAQLLGHVPERRPGGSLPPAAASAIVPGPTAATRTTEIAATVREDVATALPAPAAAPKEPGPSAADFRRTRYVAPTYPAQALSRAQAGEVRVRITVATDGRVAGVQVVSASPPGVFDQAAVNAVRKWRFEPVIKDGRAIEASIATTIRFRPDDAASP